MNKSRFYIFIALLWTLFSSMGCSDDPTKEKEKMTLTFVACVGGIENNGYMEAIFSSVKDWTNSHPDVQCTFIEPMSMKKAELVFADWKENSMFSKESLIILAGSEYQELIKSKADKLEKNQHVLFLEHPQQDSLPANVSSFYIERKGICYLTGCLAKQYDSSLILAALEEEENLQNSIMGFSAGLKSASGKVPTIEYLSDDFGGFYMPEKAKEIASNHPDAFIFPLLGQSIEGVFDALDECSETNQLVASGMDVNCNDESPRIVASVVLNYDKVLDDFLDLWINNQDLPIYIKHGMRDGYADLVINPNYKTINGVSLTDYQAMKEEYWDEALRYEER